MEEINQITPTHLHPCLWIMNEKICTLIELSSKSLHPLQVSWLKGEFGRLCITWLPFKHGYNVTSLMACLTTLAWPDSGQAGVYGTHKISSGFLQVHSQSASTIDDLSTTMSSENTISSPKRQQLWRLRWVTENASLISYRSTSSLLNPACSSALGIASAGEVGNFSGLCLDTDTD